MGQKGPREARRGQDGQIGTRRGHDHPGGSEGPRGIREKSRRPRCYRSNLQLESIIISLNR
jgi:hypothetical protein